MYLKWETAAHYGEGVEAKEAKEMIKKTKLSVKEKGEE